MSSQNFIKNITSKDIAQSNSTIKNMIKTANVADFNLLCQSAEYIFPFLKERITRDFVKIINKENLNVVFEFSKIYCSDFEDLIVNSWIKFANEDLTDEILDLFENGTDEQKTYCAKYFSKIQDPLAIEYLNKFAKSDFEALRLNCAIALSAFLDVEVLNEMKNIVLNSNDEFEKLRAFNFIVAYGKDEQIKFVLENAFNSPFATNIITNIMDFCDINHLKNILNNETLNKILQLIIEEYPEDIPLDTCYYWNLIDYMKLIYSFDNQYSRNILLIAKIKFDEFYKNDIYTFDFDKNVKEEVKNIYQYLNSLNIKIDDLSEELKKDKFHFDIALNIIKELKLNQYSNYLAQLIEENQDDYEKIAKLSEVLKEINETKLINTEIIEKIKNENIKALIKSYINA